ncbi:hypothetical protein D915_008779 [Fasciola hepatica]|uniref:Uncharacterized protein n=1 Tax=Fasciola hepatica TaxID=6192 RepID=A0A4E0RTX8_FASHE|nr:hypothetical protein D915_008779 [Fasciola hepatica]
MLRNLEFTRHDIPQTQFSSFLSLHRLKNFRDLMHQHKCDAFLIILGIDSKFNCGSTLAISYLLFDLFETREADMNQSKFDMDTFEDLIICVRYTDTHIYCNAANSRILLPYISHWPNLRIHCVNETDMTNLDTYEERKMSIFSCLTQDCKRIAIVYLDQHGNIPSTFTKMQIEDWPVVQSFAFDIARQSAREFFTLSREVINLARDVQQLTTRLDPVFIETVLLRTLLTFTGSLETVYRLVDAYVESKNRSNKVKLLEPLMSAYQNPNSVDKEDSRVALPYFLFGKDASKQNILSKSIGRKYFENLESSEASHAIVRGCTLAHGLVCERTCFFQSPVSSDSEEVSRSQHTSKLIEIYTRLLKTLWKFVDDVRSESLPIETILQKSQEALKISVKQYNCGGTELKLHYPQSDNLQSVCLAVLSGAIYDVIDEDSTPLGSVVVADTIIISTIQLNRTLISRKVINLTDSVAHVCLWLRSPNPFKPGQIIGNEKQILCDEPMDLVITPMNIPGLTTANFAWSSDSVVIHGKRVGITCVTPSKVFYYRPIDTERPEILQVVLSEYSKSPDDLIASPIQLALTESTNCPQENTDNGDEQMDVTTLRMKLCSSLWVLLKPKSRAKRLFMDKVAPIWRSRGVLIQTETLPPPEIMRASLVATILTRDGLSDLRNFSSDKSVYLKQFSISQLVTQQMSNEAWLEIHRSDLQHIEASCCLSNTIPNVHCVAQYATCCGLTYPSYQPSLKLADDSQWISVLGDVIEYNMADHESRSAWTGKVLKSEESKEEEGSPSSDSRSSFVITVICGPIGSRKDMLMQNLIRMVKEGTRWIEMRPSSVNDLGSSLLSGLGEWVKCDSTNTEDKPIRVRGLLLCPGICGAREVLAVLAKMHTNDEQSATLSSIRIGCVVTCVDIRCAIMDNGRCTFPGVLELIAEGWTNYLIHTGPPKSKQVAATKWGVQMEEVERLLRSVNPRLSQLSAPDGDTGHGHVLEALLDEDAFEQPAMQRARLLSYPNLIVSPCEPRLQNFTLRFARPLDRVRFTRSLKTLFNTLKPWPFHGNIYSVHGQVAFINGRLCVCSCLHCHTEKNDFFTVIIVITYQFIVYIRGAHIVQLGVYFFFMRN